jgi:hypothetical protein
MMLLKPIIPPVEAPLLIKARSSPGLKVPSSLASSLVERAYQNREVSYFLQAARNAKLRPLSRLYRDAARRRHLCQHRPSWQQRVEAVGAQSRQRRSAALGDSDPQGQPVRKGESARLRFSEAYTDPERYGVAGDELVWHRSFGRPLNTVVLPAGWVLTDSSIPATVEQTDDGRARLEYINPD